MLTRALFLKLFAPVVLLSLCLVGLCIAGALYLNHINEDFNRMMKDNIESNSVAGRLEERLKVLIGALRSDPKKVDHAQLTETLHALNQQFRNFLGTADKVADDLPERNFVDQIKAGYEAYLPFWRARVAQPTDRLAAYDATLAERLEKDALPASSALHHHNSDQLDLAFQGNRVVLQRLTWGLLGVGIAAPLCGLVLGYALARKLSHQIYQLRVRIRDAAGRLNSDLHPVIVDEPSDLPELHHQMQGVIEEIEAVVERLQQRERAMLRAEQLAAVGQVAAGVAHELRNPLTSVKMLAQTGLEGPQPTGLPPEDLAIIEHEVRRMEGCIQTFLDFARPPCTERRHTDLLAIVRRALALVEGRARRQKVALTPDLPPGPIELLIDAEQIHQVLVNLLLNALDALPRGGNIRLEVFGPTAESRVVTVRVRDTGPGIPPQVKARLFEPFVSGKETGLGLGLSISRRLIEAHGGTIHGDNAPEGGAAFTFTLPL